MLKMTLFVAALTALSLTAEASALPGPLNAMIEKELKEHASPKRLQAGANAQSCAQFAGQWEGTCEVKGQSIQAAFEVKQKGCSTIEIGGDKIEMGQNKSESNSSVWAVANAHANTRFSQDGQTAKLIANVLLDSPFFPDSVSGRVGGEMRLAGAELQIDGQMDFWVGMKGLVSIPGSCRLQKKN